MHVLVPVLGEEYEPEEGQNRVVAIRHEETGLRIVLDENGGTEHDVYIERVGDKWVILLHPNASDPVVGITIIKDRLTVENYEGDTLLTKEVDEVKPEMKEPQACDRCQDIYDEARGDGYCGLCPSCADEDEQEEVEFYCQVCDEEGTEDDFTPTDGNPAPHICPKCGSTNVFPKD